MSKKLQRILSGTLAALFVGQVMIYGDGASQGIFRPSVLVPSLVESI